MRVPDDSSSQRVGLGEVLITEDLARRPQRPPDHDAEAAALASLAEALATDPRSLPQTLADLTLTLCRAESVGVSNLEAGEGEDKFPWSALSGRWTKYKREVLPRSASPAGAVLDQGVPILFDRPGRHFTALSRLTPEIQETLIVPFQVNRKPIGTIWAILHSPNRGFDGEDLRLLTNLSRFAAAGYQMIAALDTGQDGSAPTSGNDWKLHKSEKNFRALGDLFAQAAWEAGADGRAMSDLSSWWTYTGQAPGEAWSDDVHPDDREAALTQWRSAIASGEPLNSEFRIRGPSGHWQWANVRAAPLHNPDGSIRKWVGMSMDITTRKEAENALRELLATGRMAYWVWNPAGHTLMVSEWMAELFGLPPGESQGDIAQTFRLIHPEDRPRLRALTEQGIREGGGWHTDFRVIRPTDGSIVWLEERARALHDPATDKARFHGLIWEITDRRRTEEALRASEERQAFLLKLSDALRSLSNPIEVQDVAMRLLGQRLGISRALYFHAEWENSGWIHVIESDGWRAPDAPSMIGRYPRAFRDRSLYDGLEHGEAVRHADICSLDLPPDQVEAYRTKDVRAVAAVPIIKAGQFLGGVCLKDPQPHQWTDEEMALTQEVAERTWDAIERSRVESALRANEERFRALVTAGSYSIYRMSPDWRTMYQLDSETLAVTSEPIEDWPDKYILEEDRPRVFAAIEQAIRTKSLFELEHRVRLADGGIGWALSRAVSLLDSEGGILEWFGARSNVTERREATERLRASEERLRLALSAARMGVWLWDVEGDEHVRDANFNRILGLAPIETRQPFAKFLASIHPDDRAIVDATFHNAVRTGHPLNVEFRVIRPDGTIRWLRDQGDLFGGVEDRPPRLAGACTDLTDLKEAEEALRHSRDELEERVAERTEELAQANSALHAEMIARMELLKRLVSAQENERRRIARDLHDGLGQELTALLLGLGALESVIPEDSIGQARLLDVELAATRIGREIHDLAIDLRPTALDDLGLATALVAYVARWSDRTRISAEFQPLGFDGDRFPTEVETTIYRVVQEALNNIAKHASARFASVIVERRGNELITLIEDDGLGFDPSRSFESERQPLGLLGMRERVSLVGGTLLIESGPGRGTTVRARIPLGPTEELSGDVG